MHERLFRGRLIPAAALAAALIPGGIAAQEAKLDDASIAHIAVTANAIDVAMGELALELGSDGRVEAFARTMITDHTAVNEQAAALVERLGVTPKDNAVSQQLQAGAAAARDELVNLPGSGFDRAYMAREVAYHQAVLDALDDVLIPNTTNGELRSLLEQARGAVAAHLAHAKELQAALGGEE